MDYQSFDQSKNIYNTQGKIVNKTQHQIFSDKFQCYLKNNTRIIDKPIYQNYINQCYPAVCNPIKWDISEKIINIQYLNSNICNNSCQSQLYRIG